MDRFPIGDNSRINFPQLSVAFAIIARPDQQCRSTYRPFSIRDLRGVRIEGVAAIGHGSPVLLPRYSRHRVIYWPSLYCGPYPNSPCLPFMREILPGRRSNGRLKVRKLRSRENWFRPDDSCRSRSLVFSRKRGHNIVTWWDLLIVFVAENQRAWNAKHAVLELQ